MLHFTTIYLVDFELLGEIKPHNLKAGGADILVNEENKVKYNNYRCLHFKIKNLISLSKDLITRLEF